MVALTLLRGKPFLFPLFYQTRREEKEEEEEEEEKDSPVYF